MTGERWSPSDSEEHLWTLSAVSKVTGIGPHTLRAWEKRFGFPSPVRMTSKHRRYSNEEISRLRLISQAMAMGHRAGTVVPLPLPKLKALLSGSAARSRGVIGDANWQHLIISSSLDFDRETVVVALQKASAELGIRLFLRERVAPLVIEIGQAWAQGRLDIRHEHFLSEILEDFLRGLRAPLESGVRGRPLLLATLPNEMHSLGLQMAALTSVMIGRRVRLLGTRTPTEEILASVERLDPVALGLSVTGSSALPETTAMVNGLRTLLPRAVGLWVGGAGAAELNNLDSEILVLENLEDIERQISSLPPDSVD
jgi:methanogenic corrinoid protein MtbC1/predicted DNA-binding transcriptional regulator AlpA